MKNIEKDKGPATGKAKPSNTENNTYNANFKGLIDVVWTGKQVEYLVKKKDELALEKEHAEGQEKYRPPKRNKLPIALVDARDVMTAYKLWQTNGQVENQRLFADIVEYLATVSDLPRPALYPLLAAWVMHTYRQEYVSYSPIICFYAVAERGKTRTGKALTSLAYRGVRLTSLREASIFRAAENLNASLFFDISDMWDTVKKNNCEDILLNRFEKGSTVPRVLYPEKGAFEDTHYYEVFGPTIIATNTPLNEIMETRSIVLSMAESKKRFANEISIENTTDLRARLLAFRAFYLNEHFPEPDKLFAGRLGDMLRPLHTMIRFLYPKEEQSFIQLAQEIRKACVSQKAMTREGRVLQTIINLEPQVENGILTIEDITASYNIYKPERYHLSSKSIGRIAQSLGFYSGNYRPKTADGKAAIAWDEPFITSLANSYGLEFQLGAPGPVSEVSDLSDVLLGVEVDRVTVKSNV